MKAKIYLIIFTFLLVSCDDFLEVYPFQSLEASQAIRTESDLQNAINGCYDIMQSIHYDRYALLLFLELASDNARNTGTVIEYGQVNNNNVLENNPMTTGIWRNLYIGVNRANTAIYHLKKLELGAEKEAAYEAELRFLRAWHFFNLAMIYKDVPLRTEPTLGLENINMAASTQQVIFDFIISELEFAKGKLTGTSRTRANNNAVNAFLARVHLYTGNYAEAAQFASEVINTSGAVLATDYASLFAPGISSESIFEIDYTAQDGNRLAQYFFPSSLAGRYEVAPNTPLLEAYEDQDERKGATFDTSGANPYTIKYKDITNGTDNLYLFRLTEMYLVRAEALARTSGNMQDILGDINRIRNRASLENASAGNHNEVLLLVENERRLEFAFEGHRWFDLVRTGRAIELMESVTNASQFYFPIPLSETNTNDAL